MTASATLSSSAADYEAALMLPLSSGMYSICIRSAAQDTKLLRQSVTIELETPLAQEVRLLDNVTGVSTGTAFRLHVAGSFPGQIIHLIANDAIGCPENNGKTVSYDGTISFEAHENQVSGEYRFCIDGNDQGFTSPTLIIEPSMAMSVVDARDDVIVGSVEVFIDLVGSVDEEFSDCCLFKQQWMRLHRPGSRSTIASQGQDCI